MAYYRHSRRRLWVLLALLALGLILAIPSGVRALLWHEESNPVLRGRLLARDLGCFACHRPWGSTEIPNPGSRWGSVPRFAAGNALMYASDRATLEEVIRRGAPAAWLDSPAGQERRAAQPVVMPAYGEILDDDQIADLVAFAAAVEGVGLVGDPGSPEARGRTLAREHGCLACHGVEGSGGLPNPRSLGGFIPGFIGDNFPDLVRDRAEFGEWILEGTSRRLEHNPLIRHFWRRQDIQMPAYRGRLSEAEIDDLWAWVQALRD